MDIGGDRVVEFVVGDGQIKVVLAMPGLSRGVDVSVCPATTLRAVAQAARRNGLQATRAEAVARRSLTEAAEAAGAWSGGSGVEFRALLGGAAFPVLGAAYEAGAGAIDEVPRWAVAALSSPTAGDAAERSFGVHATRPVVAAFARSLVRTPTEPVDLTRFGLALVGREVLQPDQLAELLGVDGEAWPVRLLPDRHQLELGRQAARRWGPDRTLRVLREALQVDDGRRLLWNTVANAVELVEHEPVRLPNDLVGLHRCYRDSMDLAIPAVPDRPPAQRRPRRPTVPRGDAVRDESAAVGTPIDNEPAQTRRSYGLHYAPRVTRTVTVDPSTPLVHPAWLRGVHGTTFGEIRLLLPLRGGDLERWGAILHNCLHTYKSAVATGASHLIGVQLGDRLTFVVEVRPDRTIRQFAGRGNRAPDTDVHDRVVEILRAAHVVR